MLPSYRRLRSSLQPLRRGLSASSGTRGPGKYRSHAFQVFDLHFLGSGGAQPSRARGHPCTMMSLGTLPWLKIRSIGRLCIKPARWVIN